MSDITHLAHAIEGLTAELHSHHIKGETQLILSRIDKLENTIMSAISDFKAKMDAHNDAMDTAIAGLQGDIKNLNDQITALQNSPGTITPADQALLDGIEAKAKSIADQLGALDAITPPAPPTP